MRVCECVWAHQRTAAGWINSQEPWRTAYIHHYLLSWSTHAHTHKRKHTHTTSFTPPPFFPHCHQWNLLWAVILTDPHLQSVSSLHHYGNGLNSSSVCVCMYVCMLCVPLWGYNQCLWLVYKSRRMSVYSCLFFNMSPMQCGLAYFPMNHIGVWVIRCPSWSEKDVSEKIAVMLSKG